MTNWIERQYHAIGGLTEIGFIPGTELLLVLSSQGKGIFDCRTNTKIARDKSDYYYEGFYESCKGKGIGEFNEKKIRVGGFDCPDILSKSTPSNWIAIVDKEEVDKGKMIRIILKNAETEETVYQAINMPINRSYGFSDSGNTFVWARSSDLHIYNLDYGFKYENRLLIKENPTAAMRLWALTTDTIFQDQDEDLLFYNNDCVTELITLCSNPNNLRQADTIKVIAGYLKTLKLDQRKKYFDQIRLANTNESLEMRILEIMNT